MNADDFDAIVIGGGPAGSSAATWLAKEGRRVLLLERAKFPRAHIGESLLPGVLPYLDALGCREKIESAGFERKEGQTFHWGSEGATWELDFRDLDVYPYAYFVDRARFDDILLRHAESCGAEVREETTVRNLLFEGGRAVGVVARGRSGRDETFRAKFVIDASGQSAITARGAKLRRLVRGLKNVAFWSYWDGGGRLPGHKRPHILTCSIPEGWVWAIPLGDRMSVGVVTANATKADRAELGDDAWYLRTLSRCAPLAPLLEGATRATPLEAGRDWSYRTTRTSGPGIVLVGDAACFIDPILSTGVHLAMTAAYWAAACVHSSLENPALEPFFRRFFDVSYAGVYRELLTQVKEFYRSEWRRDSAYWTATEVLGTRRSFSPELSFLFVVSGLLRNAALDAPHDPTAQLRAQLGSRTGAKRAPQIDPGGPRGTRTVSAPLVWKTKGATPQLVTVRADGMRLRVVPHVPSAVADRPREDVLSVEIVDRDQEPLAIVLVEDLGAGPRVTAEAYREGVDLEALRAAVGRAYDAVAKESPARSVRARRALVRTKLATKGALLDGLSVDATPWRGRLRSGQAAITAVFDPMSPKIAPRLYVTLEPRLPASVSRTPFLRTRFLDVWTRPERMPEGDRVTDVPDAAAFLRTIRRGLAEAVRGARSLEAARTGATKFLEANPVEGFTLVTLGSLAGPRHEG